MKIVIIIEVISVSVKCPAYLGKGMTPLSIYSQWCQCHLSGVSARKNHLSGVSVWKNHLSGVSDYRNQRTLGRE